MTADEDVKKGLREKNNHKNPASLLARNSQELAGKKEKDTREDERMMDMILCVVISTEAEKKG